MSNEDSAVWVTYNGEIYNFAELHAELSGHRFVSRCDTEILLHGYEEWGIDGLLNRLRGMFAFAIYDRRGEEPVLLARARPPGNQAALLRVPRRCRRFCIRSESPGGLRPASEPQEFVRHDRALAAGIGPCSRHRHRRHRCLLPGHYLAARTAGVLR